MSGQGGQPRLVVGGRVGEAERGDPGIHERLEGETVPAGEQNAGLAQAAGLEDVGEQGRFAGPGGADDQEQALAFAHMEDEQLGADPLQRGVRVDEAWIDRGLERRLADAEHSAGAVEGRFARDVYTYGHMPIVAGVIASAAALEEITLHPKDPLALEFRVMMFSGLALFFLGVLVDVFRAYRVIARERIVGGVLTAALLLLGADLDGVVLLILLDLLILLVLIFENQRVERMQPTPRAVKA